MMATMVQPVVERYQGRRDACEESGAMMGTLVVLADDHNDAVAW